MNWFLHHLIRAVVANIVSVALLWLFMPFDLVMAAINVITAPVCFYLLMWVERRVFKSRWMKL